MRLHELLDKYRRRARRLDEDAGGWSVDVANTSLDEAREIAERMFRAEGRSLDETLPDFDRHYQMLRDRLEQSLGLDRIDMPVIEPSQLDDFDRALERGKVDIFKPWAKGQFVAPDEFDDKDEAEEWVKLGVKDGDPRDDVIDGKWTTMPAGELYPSQGTIWFDKLIKTMLKFGKPHAGSPILKQTIIVSRDGYLTDGHHRWGQVVLADPGLELNALHLPLTIERLLDIARSFGSYLGNDPKR